MSLFPSVRMRYMSEVHEHIEILSTLHVFAAEGRFGNTGNLMIRPNARTAKMMDDWIDFGLSRRSKDREMFRGDVHDQDGIGHLGKLNNTSWAACTTHESCTGTYACMYVLRQAVPTLID